MGLQICQAYSATSASGHHPLGKNNDVNGLEVLYRHGDRSPVLRKARCKPVDRFKSANPRHSLSGMNEDVIAGLRPSGGIRPDSCAKQQRRLHDVGFNPSSIAPTRYVRHAVAVLDLVELELSFLAVGDFGLKLRGVENANARRGALQRFVAQTVYVGAIDREEVGKPVSNIGAGQGAALPCAVGLLNPTIFLGNGSVGQAKVALAF